MTQSHIYDLTVEAAARHYGLTSRTIRSYLKSGIFRGVRIGGEWRCSWPDVWAVEQGPAPRGGRCADYRRPLLSKKQLAARWGISVRTVERWIVAGLPTRNILGNVRIAPVDAEVWTRQTFGDAGRAA